MVDLGESLGKAFEAAGLDIESSSFNKIQNQLHIEEAPFGLYYQKMIQLFHHCSVRHFLVPDVG